MYNVPSFTLARAAGGLLAWVWIHKLQRSITPLIILASVRSFLNRIISSQLVTNNSPKGFILGEGFLSIVNLILEGLSVPHL